jgi:phosphoglycolate phosphatase-like HAD superfamily hydrolase
MIDRLSNLLSSPTQVYIISTKEARFIKQLLALAGVDFPDDKLFGKEVKQPKYETLRQILKKTNILPQDVWFIEDRLEALELVAEQKDLERVNLYLADWGYNTQATRDSLNKNYRIKLLNLEEFTSC